jgi:hypothetical protein
MEAAPRAEAAFPPRSLVPAITGAASGVQMVVASTFSPVHQQALTLDLRVPERHALPPVPVNPLLLGVDIDKGQHARAGQQRGLTSQPGQVDLGLVTVSSI